MLEKLTLAHYLVLIAVLYLALAPILAKGLFSQTDEEDIGEDNKQGPQ